MSQSATMLVVNGIRIEMIERGRGRPLLFLHPGIGIEPDAPVLDALAARARVLAPTHPGFGRSEAPRSFDSVDDLAYFYLDLLDQLALADVAVVGVSFGGWIAAEIAIKSTRACLAPRARQSGRHQGRRPRAARHRRHLRGHRGRVPRARLSAIPRRPARLQGDARCRRAGRLAQPRSDRALRLVALHARSQAQGPAAPHPHPDAVAVGHERPRAARKPMAAPSAPPFPAPRFAPIERAGHFPHVEQPQEFADKVFAFIEGGGRVGKGARAREPFDLPANSIACAVPTRPGRGKCTRGHDAQWRAFAHPTKSHG